MEDENLDFVLQFLSDDGAPSNSENFWNVEDSSVFEDPQHLQFDEDLVGGSPSDSGSSSLGLVLPEFSIENFQQQNSSMDYSNTAPAWFQATSHSKQQESKISSSDDKIPSYWTTSSTTTTTPENSSTNSSSSSMELNDDNHPITAVTVPRDQLLSFTRADLDKFIKEVTKGRSLTKEEKAEVSRQRRLIKNRKSAQASRERKRQKVEELEKKAQDLERSNSALRERFITLKAESQCMKDELHHLETMIRSNPVLSQLYDHAKLSKKQYNQTPEQSMATLSVIMAMTLTSMQVFCTAANYAAKAASNNNQAISNLGQNGLNEAQNALEKDDCVMEDPLTDATPAEEEQQVDPSDSVSNKDSYAVDESTAAFCRSLLEEGRTEPSLPKQDASPYMLYTLLSPPPSPAYGIPLYCPCDGVMA